MATRPARACTHPGCGKRTLNGSKCDKHRNAQDKQRGTRHERGYGYRWERFRKVFLDRHPLCVRCQDNSKIVPATVVDHIIPHKGDQELFWRTGNHQSLCASHHSSKTVREDGGFGN